MKKEWSPVDVLRHARHDWLNKIQLIKGNLDLNKIERVKQLISEIVLDAQAEANLSNLRIPRFAALILTSNWESFSFQVEFEVINEVEVELSVDDLLLADWTESYFTCLHTSIDPYHNNNLSVTIETQTNGIRFFFDFSGIIRDKEKLQQYLDFNPFNELTVKVLEFSQQELALEVFSPFR